MDLRRTLTHRRLTGQLSDVIYSMEATNTDFYPYQFKPVLKLLQAPTNGILIADEVGLGKTIEAGLAWMELRSRFDLRRLLVICPAALREKWRWELRAKFGVHAEIEDADGLLRTLREEPETRRGFAVISSMQGLRPPRGLDQGEPKEGPRADLARLLLESESAEPLVDLLVIDEAHHMRNSKTMSHRLGELLRAVSDFKLLLTATPVHNSSDDLFATLGLLDPDTFQRRDDFVEILDANEPLVRARDGVLRANISAIELAETLREATRHRLLKGNRQLQMLLDELESGPGLDDPETRSRIAWRLEHVNLLAHTVTRTRKRDVQEWRVVRKPIASTMVMADAEQEFYDGVTELIREYALKYGVTEHFLLAMPQRQLSSCMAAALDLWRRRGLALEEIEEDAGDDSDGSDDPRFLKNLGPLSLWLAERAPALGDVATLEAIDTKFGVFRQQVVDYLGQNPDDKIVVFSSFRGTVYYLARRLRDHGISTISLMGAAPGSREQIDKQDVIAQFRAKSGPSVLLSTEVGGEGIDLQFSSVVVNYDLPWNPMRVEQRIGRLDRIGQKAERIGIWNLLHEKTIDIRIYRRLYEKLELCQRALGDFEAILGTHIRELTRDLLTKRLDAAEQDARIDQTAQALENLRREHESLEEQAGHLIAYGDYILEQVHAAHDLQRWISGEDVKQYVLDFFRQRYRGCELTRRAPQDDVYDVRLTPEAKRDLDDFVRERRMPPTALTDARTGAVPCRFAHRVAGVSGDRVELISQFHPITRFAGHKIAETEEQLTPAVAVRLREPTAGIASGLYVAVVVFWRVRGLRVSERLVYAAARSIHGTWSPVDISAAERLVVEATQRGEDWLEARRFLDLDGVTKVAEGLFEDVARRFRTHGAELRAENDDRADVQERTLRRHLGQQELKLGAIRDKHEAHGRRGLVRATEGRLSALRDRVDRQLARIAERRVVEPLDDELLVAVIDVEGEGGESG